jgi:hypothetical protein
VEVSSNARARQSNSVARLRLTILLMKLPAIFLARRGIRSRLWLTILLRLGTIWVLPVHERLRSGRRGIRSRLWLTILLRLGTIWVLPVHERLRSGDDGALVSFRALAAKTDAADDAQDEAQKGAYRNTSDGAGVWLQQHVAVHQQCKQRANGGRALHQQGQAKSRLLQFVFASA